MRPARLDPDQVLAAAERLVGERGWEGLTMAALAAELGVRAPSLYRHVDSLDALRQELRLRSVVELGEAVRAAVMGKSGDEGLHALTDAYRAYAQAHPVRYLAQTGLAGNDAMRAAGTHAGEAGYAVLASFGLAEEELPVATAQLAALVHGFVSLELVQSIDWVTDPDAAYHGLVDLFATGLRNR
ncbi:MAG: transcriptional regulator [Actinomycetia bacterium]|nr:transcriptional regulator [Actinomycetes bacterium]